MKIAIIHMRRLKMVFIELCAHDRGSHYIVEDGILRPKLSIAIEQL